MKGKKIFEILKLIIIAVVVLVFVQFLIDFERRKFLNIAIDLMLYTSIANIVVNIIENLVLRKRTLSSLSIVTSLWFGFLKFTNVFGYFLIQEGVFEKGFLIVLTSASLIFLALYGIRTVSELLNRSFKFRMRPYNIIALSFMSVIFVGSILLFMPVSQAPDSEPISLLDALFTATSAVCVTGLTVKDTGTYFSQFGQIIILIMLQIGGLGIMTFGAFFAQLLGQKISYHNKFTLQNAVNEMKISGTGRYIVAMILATFSIEFIGAALLFVRFIKLMPVQEAVYYSVFHAVSAFCNAGFGLYTDSLTIFRGDILVNLTVMALIVLGGIGFSVLVNVSRIVRKKTPFLSLHSKIVLLISGILILSGAVFVFLIEHNGAMAGLSIKEKILASFFTSVTSRTAGFNTIDMGVVSPATVVIVIILMFIGASPGSTGGGVKTTTFAVIISTIVHTIRERPVVTLIDREIPLEIIRKSLTIMILALTWILAVTTVMGAIEPFKAEQIAFEVVSAFGTVGLSTGITAQLSPVSKALIIVTMFIGRVGPLTLMASIGFLASPTSIRRPEERLLIG